MMIRRRGWKSHRMGPMSSCDGDRREIKTRSKWSGKHRAVSIPHLAAAGDREPTSQIVAESDNEMFSFERDPALIYLEPCQAGRAFGKFGINKFALL